MPNVKLIHSGWLSAPNGANTVMNALLNSKEQFEANNIFITSLTLDTCTPRSFSNAAQQSCKAIWRARIKRWLKQMSKYSRLASDIVIYLSEIRPAKKVVNEYLKSNPDTNEVVFFHNLIPCFYYIKQRKKRQRTVLVCHTNGDNFKMHRIYYPTLEHSRIYKKMLEMEKYVMGHVDRINFVAYMAKDNFLKLHPSIEPCKVSYIYNGVKNEIRSCRSRKQDGVIEFCCVASISKRKGQIYILEALKMFKEDSRPKVHFTFVGDGIDKRRLEEEVHLCRLDDYISFVGVSQNVDDYLVNSDVFILPSEDEGLPMAIIEAMRASLPIVATLVGGIPEMVDNGVNGLLIYPNANDVFEVLNKIDSYDWQAMGRNARNTFENKFTLDKMVDGYSKLLSFVEIPK